jgi:hypothetical protein
VKGVMSAGELAKQDEKKRVKSKELSGHCTLIASAQFLMPVQAGRPVPFACGEPNGLG